jgi:hypothetical protein
MAELLELTFSLHHPLAKMLLLFERDIDHKNQTARDDPGQSLNRRAQSILIVD